MRTIAEKYNIPIKSVENSIKRLTDNNFIIYDQLKSESTEYVFNEYSFKCRDKRGIINTPFIMLDPVILKLEMAPKDRGVLIALHLLTLEGMNQIIEKTAVELAGRLGITRQTISKYVKKFLSLKEITVSAAGYYTVKYISNAPIINNETNLITITL